MKFVYYVISVLTLFLIESSAILNGESCRPGQYPFMVLLVTTEFDNIRSGSLLSETKILTAAQCVIAGDCTYAIAGSSDFTAPSAQYREIISWITHPEYKTGEYEHDFGIVIVDKPFSINDFVKTINIAGEPMKDGVTCMGLGYGYNKLSVDTSVAEGFLRRGLFSLEIKKCPEQALKDNPSIYCTYELLESPLHGDVGGPLVNAAVEVPDLYGVCAIDNVKHTIGIYANAVKYREWILQQMQVARKPRSHRSSSMARRFKENETNTIVIAIVLIKISKNVL